MISVFATVLAGELRLQLRQATSMALLLLLPIALAGATAIASQALGDSFMAREVSRATGMSQDEVEGDDHEAERRHMVHVPPDWEARLADRPELELVPADQAVATLLLNDAGDPVIRHELDFDSVRAWNALRHAAQDVLDAERDARLLEAGLDGPLESYLEVSTTDRATPEDRAGATTGAILPSLMLFAMLMAGLVTALDVFTGEKERRTIETLLTTRVDRRAIAAAKLGVVSASTTLAGVVFVIALGVLQRLLGADAVGGPIGPLTMVAMLGISMLLGPQVAGVTSVLGIYSDDYKTASMLSAPAMLVIMAPGVLPFLPVELDGLLAAVPIGNAALASRELLGGELGLGMTLVVVGFSAVHAGLATWVVWRLLEQETALIGSGAVTSSGERRRGGQALAVAALAFSALWFFGAPAQNIDLVGGMAFTQALLAASALAAVSWLGLPMASTLSLRLPTGRDLALTLLAGATAPAFGAAVFQLQSLFAPAPGELMEAMGELPLDGSSVWLPLLVFALLPALGEELLFRGAVLGLQRPGGSMVPVVLVNALVFGLFHIAGHRILPTAALGLLVAVAVWRSRSVLPAMIIHLMNNAGLLLIARSAGTSQGEITPATVIGATAVAAVAWAAVLGMRGRAEDQATKPA